MDDWALKLIKSDENSLEPELGNRARRRRQLTSSARMNKHA